MHIVPVGLKIGDRGRQVAIHGVARGEALHFQGLHDLAAFKQNFLQLHIVKGADHVRHDIVFSFEKKNIKKYLKDIHFITLYNFISN